MLLFHRTTIESTTAPLSDIIFPSIYVCNVNQVTKSFLNSLEPRNTTDINLIFNEFLDGVKPESHKDPAALERMVSRLRSIHRWNETVAFVSLSSQNCSEMLVIAGSSFEPTFQAYGSSSGRRASAVDPYLLNTDFNAASILSYYIVTTSIQFEVSSVWLKTQQKNIDGLSTYG